LAKLRCPFASGYLTFNGWWFLLALGCIYGVYFIQSFGGWLPVLPTVLIGLVGGRSLARAFYEKPGRKELRVEKKAIRRAAKANKRGAWRR